jgi:ribonuclease PH
MRKDGRKNNQLREVKITRNFLSAAEGSVLIEFGNTKVLCNATFENSLPQWKKRGGDFTGWVTAEYSMLPRATNERTKRESIQGKIGGRTHEISRLIGRSLRSVVDVKELGENQVLLDCDVLQADGGTRTASITGAYIALCDAISWAKQHGKLKSTANVISESVSAISVGIVDGELMLDLAYVEDSKARVDMNVVQTQSGKFIEIQGTAEGKPFDKNQLDEMLALAQKGNAELAKLQLKALLDTSV